jgi:ATP-dependent exoDNAse (exonuclease V) beta subunit
VRERHTGRWWVIDYKSSLSSETVEQGNRQVQQYMQAIAATYPGQAVLGALLSPTGMRMVEGRQQGQ